MRRAAASRLLTTLEGCAAPGTRGNDIQVETTFGALNAALAGDLEIRPNVRDVTKLLDRALLWLHEQEVVTLGKGLTIFRPAMTVRLEPGTRQFTQSDFEPLRMHYDEQTLQIHIMAEYARQGLTSIASAQSLAADYFTLEREGFIDRWLAARSAELRRQTSPASWRAIVENLRNPVQARIVADDRELTNVLVLAGPGSGKTRVLVHRIAYLIRVRRENPRGILALAYNRHAAAEIRSGLAELIGEDARGVTVCTCHGLAMRLVGASFARRMEKPDPGRFDALMQDAIALLKGEGLSREEAEAQRETLLEGYRWILVDEYQDVGPEEYALIAAVAGRSVEDVDSRLSLFAVGDDDQNIYAFAGASVEFIRRFEHDYEAKPAFLIENYRSTANIIRAANLVIAPAAERMKAGHDIAINRARRDAAEGGLLEQLDAIGRGRVQILAAGRDPYEQGVYAVDELRRLSVLVPAWDWSKVAVIAREWSLLMPVRSYCEALGVPVQMANDEQPNFWQLRETQAMIAWVRKQGSTISADALLSWLEQQGSGSWWRVLVHAVAELAAEHGGGDVLTKDLLEWLAEWGRDFRRKQSGLLLLSAHRAKGLEFDHVVVLDGGWERRSRGEDRHAARRLYYVAMTRARQGLTLMSHTGAHHGMLTAASDRAFVIRNVVGPAPDTSQCMLEYHTLDLSQVDLSFAGRLGNGNPSIRAIQRMRTGDSISLARIGDKWLICDSAGTAVGRLAQSYEPPEGANFVRGEVGAVLARGRKDTKFEYKEWLRQEDWEVVVPELVFATSRRLGSTDDDR
jgi:ATP-dependent DNA helicase RecQ